MAPNLTTKQVACRACKSGTYTASTETRVYHPPRQLPVQVTLLTSVCDQCGHQATLAAQHDENLKRLEARRAGYGMHVLPEDMLAFRRRYGLTRRSFAALLGKTEVTIKAYEEEATYPDRSTLLLLRLMLEDSTVLARLAALTKVELPLWAERHPGVDIPYRSEAPSV